jgi:protein-disulfide isomerase
VLAASLIAASQIGARESRRSTAPASRSLFAGIVQHGATLGTPRAPVTLVEFADLQCPYCAQWAHETLPVAVTDYVRSGRVRIVFRGLAFLGADSETALEAVVAAGRQNKWWNLVHALYERQGLENSGWVEDELANAIASVRGLDAARLDREARSRATDSVVVRDAISANAMGVRGTPSFAVGPTGGRLRLIALQSLSPEGIRPALDAALAR